MLWPLYHAAGVAGVISLPLSALGGRVLCVSDLLAQALVPVAVAAVAQKAVPSCLADWAAAAAGLFSCSRDHLKLVSSLVSFSFFEIFNFVILDASKKRRRCTTY